MPVVSYRGNSVFRLWNSIKYKLVYSLFPLRWVYEWFLPKGNDVEIAFCEGYVTKLLSHAKSRSYKIAWVHTDLTNNPWPLDLGIYRNVEYDRLLRVAKRLHDEGREYQLTILGEGQERSSLEQYIVGNQMATYVSLPGFVKNPYEQLAHSDVFVCPSRVEGFSLVIAEAMALGIPVISTYCSGPNELLQKGKCGMLVDNSENGIYHGLENVLLNKEQMADCIEAAREKIFGFSPTIIINQIEALLDD